VDWTIKKWELYFVKAPITTTIKLGDDFQTGCDGKEKDETFFDPFFKVLFSDASDKYSILTPLEFAFQVSENTLAATLNDHEDGHMTCCIVCINSHYMMIAFQKVEDEEII
jgi:hypothetical protein